MAKHDVDPVLRQLVRAVNESAQAEVPVVVSVHGTTMTGTLIAQSRYFGELITDETEKWGKVVRDAGIKAE